MGISDIKSVTVSELQSYASKQPAKESHTDIDKQTSDLTKDTSDNLKSQHIRVDDTTIESAKMRIPKSEFSQYNESTMPQACADITNVTATNEVTQMDRNAHEYAMYSDVSRCGSVTSSPAGSHSNRSSPVNSRSPIAEVEQIYAAQTNTHHIVPQPHSANISPPMIHVTPEMQTVSPVPQQQRLPSIHELSPAHAANYQNISPAMPAPAENSTDGYAVENHFYTSTAESHPVNTPAPMYTHNNQPPAPLPPPAGFPMMPQYGMMPNPAHQNSNARMPLPAHSTSAPHMMFPPPPPHVMPPPHAFMPPGYEHFASQWSQWQQFFHGVPPQQHAAPFPMPHNADSFNTSNGKAIKNELSVPFVKTEKCSPTLEEMDAERSNKRARRGRTRITDSQQARLEELFEQNTYPDAYRREEIALELGFPDEVVRVWFKNRRARHKKIAMKKQRIAAAIAKTEPFSPPLPVSLPYPLPAVSSANSSANTSPVNTPPAIHFANPSDAAIPQTALPPAVPLDYYSSMTSSYPRDCTTAHVSQEHLGYSFKPIDTPIASL